MSLRIVAAANKHGDCIFTGVHHHLILWQMACCGVKIGGIQGFMSSDGKFVDREEARKIAQAAGQIVNPLSHSPKELFSEELWSWKDWCNRHKHIQE